MIFTVLGVTIYEAITGDNPFRAQRPSIGMFRQVHLKIPALKEFNSAISSYMVQIVEAMLEKDSVERPEPEETAEVFTLLLEFLQKKSNKFHAERSYYAQKFSGKSYRASTSYDMEEVRGKLENLDFFKRKQTEKEEISEKRDTKQLTLSRMRRFAIAAVMLFSISGLLVSGYMIYRDRYSALKSFVPDYGEEYLDDAETFIPSSHAGKRKCTMCRLIYSTALFQDSAKLSTPDYEKTAGKKLPLSALPFPADQPYVIKRGYNKCISGKTPICFVRLSLLRLRTLIAWTAFFASAGEAVLPCLQWLPERSVCR